MKPLPDPILYLLFLKHTSSWENYTFPGLPASRFWLLAVCKSRGGRPENEAWSIEQYMWSVNVIHQHNPKFIINFSVVYRAGKTSWYILWPFLCLCLDKCWMAFQGVLYSANLIFRTLISCTLNFWYMFMHRSVYLCNTRVLCIYYESVFINVRDGWVGLVNSLISASLPLPPMCERNVWT